MRVYSQIMKQIVLIGLVELTILYLVKGQDKFPLTLEVSPSSRSPGVTLNITCSFKLLKSEFSDVRVREGTTLIFISNDDWRTNWPKVKDYGQILSETEEQMSKVWLTLQPSFCDKEMEKKYEFQVGDKQLGFTTKTASVPFAAPSLKVFLNNEEICQDGTHTEGSEAVGKEQTFKLVAEHELEEIEALELKVANKTFSTFTPNNDDAAVCVYGGEVSATFPNPGEFTLEYTINQKDSGGPVPKTCKIEIEEEPTTVATTTTELPKKKSVTVTTDSPQPVTTEQGLPTASPPPPPPCSCTRPAWKLPVFIIVSIVVIVIIGIVLWFTLKGPLKKLSFFVSRKKLLLIVIGTLIGLLIIGVILFCVVGKLVGLIFVIVSDFIIIGSFGIYVFVKLRAYKGRKVPPIF